MIQLLVLRKIFMARTELIKIFHFILCGVISLAIFYVFLYFSVEILFLDNILSISISYFLSSFFNFIYNKYITFASIGNSVIQVIKYIVILLINYLFSLIIITELTLYFSIYISSALSALLTMIMKFIFFRYLVFK